MRPWSRPTGVTDRRRAASGNRPSSQSRTKNGSMTARAGSTGRQSGRQPDRIHRTDCERGGIRAEEAEEEAPGPGCSAADRTPDGRPPGALAASVECVTAQGAGSRFSSIDAWFTLGSIGMGRRRACHWAVMAGGLPADGEWDCLWSICASARRATVRSGRNARAVSYCWRARSSCPVAASR